MEERSETTYDGDEAPKISKNRRKKNRRKGIDGSFLKDSDADSPLNEDVDNPPNVNSEGKVEENKEENKKSAGNKKKRTAKDSRFFGIKPTESEISNAREILTMAQAMLTKIPPAIMVGQNPDGTPIIKPLVVADFKTSVYEMDEKGTIKAVECTYAYKIAKIGAISSGGIVGKLEDFCENNPFVASLGLAVITAFGFSAEMAKLEKILSSQPVQATQNQNHQDSVQNQPINNDGEPIKVTPL